MRKGSGLFLLKHYFFSIVFYTLILIESPINIILSLLGVITLTGFSFNVSYYLLNRFMYSHTKKPTSSGRQINTSRQDWYESQFLPEIYDGEDEDYDPADDYEYAKKIRLEEEPSDREPSE